jgi:hypothetical protein
MVDHHPDREMEREADRTYRVRKQQPDHDADALASKIAMDMMKTLAMARPISFQSLKEKILEELKEFHVKQIRPQR